MLKTGIVIAGLLAGVGTPLGAQASDWKRHQHPPGWKVNVDAEAIAQRQDFYGFQVTVRDASGRPVEDADVVVRLHSFKEPGYRLVRASRIGRGFYRAAALVHRGLQSPYHVRAVVRPDWSP